MPNKNIHIDPIANRSSKHPKDDSQNAMLQDAMEGLSMLSTEDTDRSISNIHQQLQEQIQRRQALRKPTRKERVEIKQWVTITIFIVLMIIAIAYIIHITGAK